MVALRRPLGPGCEPYGVNVTVSAGLRFEYVPQGPPTSRNQVWKCQVLPEVIAPPAAKCALV